MAQESNVHELLFTGLPGTSSADDSATGDPSEDTLCRRHKSNAPLAPLVMPALISCHTQNIATSEHCKQHINPQNSSIKCTKHYQNYQWSKFIWSISKQLKTQQ